MGQEILLSVDVDVNKMLDAIGAEASESGRGFLYINLNPDATDGRWRVVTGDTNEKQQIEMLYGALNQIHTVLDTRYKELTK